MIVDTSALVAIVFGEPGWEDLRYALTDGQWSIPAPVLTELHLVAAGSGADDVARATELVEGLLAAGHEVAVFTERHARLTWKARDIYGKGNGRGGLLNFDDLMVYAIAKDRSEPLLCTGQDFATTDLEIHPASRLDH